VAFCFLPVTFNGECSSYYKITQSGQMTVEEFNTCVDLYADNLYRFILKNIKDDDKAKDVVQDTYEKLWLKVSEVESTNAKSYMFTTAYRTMIDRIRRDKKQGGMEEANLYALSHEKQYTDLKKILNDAVDKLPEIQRSVIMLRDYEGYSYQEVGQITNLSESQVKVYIFRARAFLKNYLGSMEKVI
jgi:RNA polymerase sigma factor (sigma-70 family)